MYVCNHNTLKKVINLIESGKLKKELEGEIVRQK